MHVCVYWSCLKGGVWWKTAFMKRKINFLCHTTSAAVTKISDLIGWRGERQHVIGRVPGQSRRSTTALRNGFEKTASQSIWLSSSLSLCLLLSLILLSVSLRFLLLQCLPNPMLHFHIDLSISHSSSSQADSQIALVRTAATGPQNSIDFLNSSCSTDDLGKKSISPVTRIN